MNGFKSSLHPLDLRLLLLLVIIPTAFKGIGCSQKSGSLDNGKSPTASGRVEMGDVQQRITAPGVVTPKRSSTISTPFAGYVRKIFVQMGEKVTSGSPVVSVVQSASTPDTEVFPLRAPFAGTVVQILKTEGEYVEIGGTNSALVRVDDLSQLQVEAAVPELDYPKLKLNQEVRIRISALPGRLYKGVIRRISLAAREKKDFMRGTIEFPVKIEILDSDQWIKPGMSATLDVIAEQKTQVLRVSNLFLRRGSEGYEVTLKNGEVRKIKVGLQSDEYSELLEGLSEGDELQPPRATKGAKPGHSS